MRNVVRSMARRYIRSFPFEKGKYRIAQAMRPLDGKDIVIGDILGRFEMELDLSETLQGLLFYFGYYEKALSRLIERSIGPGLVMVDVGANVGTFSLLAASLGATCHSFEASPVTAAVFRRNIALNGFDAITVHECALADHCGETSFFLYEEGGQKKSWGNSALFRRGTGREIRVPMRTLDCTLRDLARIDFIKSDIEGADLLALRGAHEILDKFHPMLAIEADQSLASRLGGSIREILELLEQYGYDIWSLTPTTMDPITSSSATGLHYTLIAQIPKSSKAGS